jgi:predicted TIM-barrel fold metal-dependent hydrolase
MRMTATPRRLAGCACCQTLRFSADGLSADSPVLEGVDRRSFLAGSAAAGIGAAAVLRPSPAPAQAGPAKRIDVHHHFLAPFHREVLQVDRGSAGLPKWTVEGSLQDMDKAGVATAMLSVMQPGVWFGNIEQARSLARRCNDYAAQLVKDHPGKFGMFATVALPDTEGSLKEIEYGLDVLKAGGIALMTSYHDKYLGDPAFLPVFEELNRRKAVVYVHPNTPDCCKALVKGLPVGTIEYATDTTRTISSLIFGEAGTAFKCPDIRFIWSHSGGTLPFLTGRLIRLAGQRKDARMPDGPIPILKRYNYEIAQGNTAGQLAALMKLVPVSQVMFGSDYPFVAGIEAVEGLTEYRFSEADQRAIERENALKLLPGVKAG